MGFATGFNGPTSNLVCFVRFGTERFGCEVTSASASTNYYTYRLQTYENLPANQDYEITLTTQDGDSTEGIKFPVSRGNYKV